MNSIILHTKQSIEIIYCKNIISLQASGSYCELKTTEGKLTVSKNLLSLQKMLTSREFFRTHRSHIVNFNYVLRYNKMQQVLELINGDTVPLSNTYIADLPKMLLFREQQNRYPEKPD